jgi:hypothetical protein
MRIVWQMTGVNKDVNFGVYYTGGRVRSHLNVSVQIVSGNNQMGAANTMLPAPLVVSVVTRNDNGEIVSQQQTVRFRVMTGNGTLADSLVTTDASGRAQTTYTVGSSGSGEIQRICAEVIDDKGDVISNTVQFQTLTSNERWRVRLKCIVQGYFVLTTDFDLQLSENNQNGVIPIEAVMSPGYDYDYSGIRALVSGTYNPTTHEVDLTIVSEDNELGYWEQARTDRFTAILSSDYIYPIYPYSTSFEEGWYGCEVEIDMTHIGANAKGVPDRYDHPSRQVSQGNEQTKFIMRVEQ